MFDVAQTLAEGVACAAAFEPSPYGAGEVPLQASHDVLRGQPVSQRRAGDPGRAAPRPARVAPTDQETLLE